MASSTTKKDKNSSSEPSQNAIDRTREDATQRAQCEARLKLALSKNSDIQLIRKALAGFGCNIKDQHFSCQPCDDSATGFFNNMLGIVSCQNNIHNQADLENNVVHELIHAYDWFRFKIDDNCKHVACTEIRAANLSQDCSWYNEFRRGNFGIAGQQRKCVKRRAILSAQYHPSCNGIEGATKAVEEVFESCYSDHQPFTPPS